MAGPPSPANAFVPFPAAVSTTPVCRFSRRTRWLSVSAMYRSVPVGSTHTLPAGWADCPTGRFSVAAVPCPPSPENPAAPVPRIVAISCVSPSTLRTRRFPSSAMYRLPAASNFTLDGRFSSAAETGPPSPLKARFPSALFTATTSLVEPITLFTRSVCQEAKWRSPSAGWKAMSVGWFMRTPGAGPLVSPSSPTPTTVRTTPSSSTRRMRWLFQSTTWSSPLTGWTATSWGQ